jgi:hypothetical protein
MRRAARVDGNQADIVGALRKVGCSIQHIHTIGGGCPDILVGRNRRNWIFELKDDKQPPNKRRLTPAEQRWHDEWRGEVHIIENIEQALAVVMDDVSTKAR